MDNEVSEVSQVENSTTVKTSWVHSSTANQIGTILWTISTVLIFLIFLNMCGMWSAIAGLIDEPSLGSIGGKISAIFVFPILILYIVISVGMFLCKNACTAIAKAYGIVTLVMTIVGVILLGVAGFFLSTTPFGQVALEQVGNVFEIAEDYSKQIDTDTLKEYTKTASEEAKKVIKENQDLVNEIQKEVKEEGKKLSDSELLEQLAQKGVEKAENAVSELEGIFSDPEVVSKVKLAIKFLKSWLFCLIVIPITQLLTIICGFMLKVNNDKKSRVVALIMCIFMGMVGGHLLYVGRTGKAVLRIIFTITFVLGFISAILCIIDFIKILAGAFYDKDKKPVVAWV